MKEALGKLMRKENLSSGEVAHAVEQILQGADAHQVAAFLALLRSKGETAEEILGIIQTMQRHMVKLEIDFPAIDLAGTGGDGKKTVNISTAASILAASCGVKVVKHGNVALSSSSGSADLLQKLGIDIHMDPEKGKKCLEEIGITFCFAPLYHPVMARVKEVRRGLGLPTTFNVIAPLLNPAQVPYCMMGVFDEKLIPLAVEVLLQMGIKRGFVFHGCGYDELTTVGPSHVVEINHGKQLSFILDPKSLGFSTCDPKELEGGTAEENAQKIRDLFDGKIRGGLADTILLNAGIAIYLYGLAKTIQEGISLAKKGLQEGKAAELLKKWRKNFLEEIVARKKEEIKALKKQSFKEAIRGGAVIAEIKRRSPSKGKLADIPDPSALAKKYVEGGAKAISVLTDSDFGGSGEDLKAVKSVSLVLRKDFILDPAQIKETVQMGADAVLLIVMLLQEKTKEMVALCKSVGLDALVEVHDEEELKIALDAGAEIIGINTRNLKTFEMDKELPAKLLPLIPQGVVKVAESGIKTPEEAAHFFRMGFDAVLVGETLVKESDPARWIRGIYAR